MHFELLVSVPRYDTVLAAKFHFGEFILGKQRPASIASLWNRNHG
jgi:hypothetical protein